ncbi:MAG TPA: hypothetical protein VGV87_21540 [Blastocatellia bacterium]|jgi:hypothetical protein|nr:hypothetical protein [Blastocatellia bacterium]
MEMEKSYYVVSFKPSYFELVRTRISPALCSLVAAEPDELLAERIVIAITQGGFGQDIIDDERQAKERFLEYLFGASGIDLPRSEDAFDEYFNLERAHEFIDLDDEG